MNEKRNILVIKLKYFSKSYEKYDNYINNIMEKNET